MSILVNENTKLLIQGITGNEGKFHGEQMINYGTKVVGGVTPGKGGETELGVPVFNSVEDAVAATGANASVIYVPAAFAADAALEALLAGLPLVVVITEGVPTTDMLKVYWTARRKGAVVIGPNCPGVISPGKAKIGIMPGHIHKPGGVGVISRSGTLTYEVVWALTLAGIGQSTCIGIGGDPIVGTGFLDALRLFKDDDETDAVILIGEIGGTEEEKAAEYIRDHLGKPACAFIAGKTAPPGKRMGHAGAIISGGEGTAQSKIAALEACGIPVADRPDAIADVLMARMKR